MKNLKQISRRELKTVKGGNLIAIVHQRDRENHL
ncbi:bacteriocin-like protein [Chryseobacterium gallinarum]